jgi:hypothetical protein
MVSAATDPADDPRAHADAAKASAVRIRTTNRAEFWWSSRRRWARPAPRCVDGGRDDEAAREVWDNGGQQQL